MNDIIIAIVPAIVIFVLYLFGILCFHLVRMWREDRRLMKEAAMRRAAVLAEISAALKTTREMQERSLERLRRRGL